MGEAAEEGANAALKISTGLEETASTVQETQANIRKSGEAFEKAQQVAVDLGDGLGDIGAAQENLVSAYQELSDSISAELNPTGGNAGAKAEAAPESSHAIKAAMDEAVRCRETGEAKTILFGLTGTGYFDMYAYESYHDGKMEDYTLTDEEIQASIARPSL